jgi:MbtH protein
VRIVPGFLDENTTLQLKVVRNDEDQYSIWPADRENPLGWYDATFSGTRLECLDHIERTWTDLRPKSLR